jgi:hypothetical protein
MKGGKIRFASLAGLVAGGALLVGCESMGTYGTSSSAQRGPAPSPMQHALLQNIPVPAGFTLVDERSVARKSGQLRVALCEFEGPAEMERVVRFYMDYMPSAKFVLKKEDFVRGEHQMRFESQTEECAIRVRQNRTKTTLVIDLGPVAKGTAERESKPVIPRR